MRLAVHCGKQSPALIWHSKLTRDAGSNLVDARLAGRTSRSEPKAKGGVAAVAPRLARPTGPSSSPFASAYLAALLIKHFLGGRGERARPSMIVFVGDWQGEPMIADVGSGRQPAASTRPSSPIVWPLGFQGREGRSG